MHANPARLRATSYVTRNLRGQDEVLVFDYDAQPALGTHLPGGGVDPGERPDTAAIRKVIEETGVAGTLGVVGTVGVQQTRYSNGEPCISVYFHIQTNDPRDRWTHTMHGDGDAWDTGQSVTCRFVTLTEASQLLKAAGYQQDEYLDHLHIRG